MLLPRPARKMKSVPGSSGCVVSYVKMYHRGDAVSAADRLTEQRIRCQDGWAAEVEKNKNTLFMLWKIKYQHSTSTAG